VWEEPRTIYGIEEDGWIPKMLSSNMIVLSTGQYWIPKMLIGNMIVLSTGQYILQYTN
jgi:hypothetical protein